MTEQSRRIVFNLYAQPSFDPGTVYLYSNEPVVQLDPHRDPTPRNAAQLQRLNAKSIQLAEGAIFGQSLAWTYRTYIVHRLSGEAVPQVDPEDDSETPAGEPLPLGVAPAQPLTAQARWRSRPAPHARGAQKLCLFNVLVALEWHPDERYLNQLEWAFRRASDFLYDITDGAMAFGQVVFGGPELMDCADVQIMASSRLHPRSWVSGLHQAHKYTPIRMGRGLWHRRNHFVIPWDEPEGYRTFIHEWAHYALGLRDQYLHQEQGLIVPDGTLASTSIMATLEGTSELVAHAGGAHDLRQSTEWQRIRTWFPDLDQPYAPFDGPGRLPLPLPAMARVGTLASSPRRKTARATSFPADLDYTHCWVYVLRGLTPGALSAPREGAPLSLIAQGTLDAFAQDDQSFALLGAQPDDTVLLLNEPRDAPLRIYRGAIGADRRASSWAPVRLDQQPVLSVLPHLSGDSGGGPGSTHIRVHMRGGAAPTQVWVFTLGQLAPGAIRLSPLDPEQAAALGFAPGDWVSEQVTVPTLDGHVLAFFGDSLLVRTFSQGGGPPTHSGVDANPVTAGSSDGNIMLFFRDEEWQEGGSGNRDYSDIKVITTLCLGTQLSPPVGGGMHSYLYNIASTQPLPPELHPTLVMFYDPEVVPADGEPAIYRLLDDGSWMEVQTVPSPNNAHVATPLTAAADPSNRLFAPGQGLRAESYRIYWRTGGGSSRRPAGGDQLH
jgi:hypothetical protein